MTPVLTAAAMSSLVYEKKGGDLLSDGDFLAVKGTDDITDVWSNLHVSRIAGYHRGFLSAAMAATNTGPHGYYTGHSRGGAVAVILAAKHNTTAITFGAPKTGSKYERVIAFALAGDIVPLLPLTYRRHHPLLYIRDGRIIHNPSTALMLYDAAVRRGVQHRMTNYEKALNEIATDPLLRAIDRAITPGEEILS